MSGLWRLATPEVTAAASLPPVASARPPLVAMSSAQELRPAERTSIGANAEDADQVFVEEDRTRFFPPGADLSSVTFDSTSPVVHCGWLYKLSVRRKVAKIFPNVGRHFNNWKKRWFILHENGNLHYYKDQDRPDVDESTAAAASPTERTSLTGTLLSSFFAPVPPPPTGSPPPVRLLLRGSLVLTGRSIAVPHAYSPVPFVLSIQLENADKDELLVRGEGRDVYEDWLFETNDCIQRLLKVGSWGDGRGEHGGKALNDLAFYVKRRLSLERNLVGASGGGADDDEEDMDEGEGEGAEDAPPGGGGISSYLASLVGGGAAASKKHEPGREAVTWIGAPQKKLKYLAGDLSAMIDKLGGVYDPTTPPPPEQGEGFVVVDEHVTVPNKERGMASGIPAPRLNIVCLVVGTYGDVTPFVAMAKKLKEMGHFVRIATHSEFREKVMNEGILFYPLAGNSQKLSQYMVKTHGKLMPNIFDANDIKLHAEDLPEKLTMLEEICFSTWPACTAPDPADPSHASFVADAIISNPVTYGHSHCAEALGIPLHMFFPQPWTPTKAFPHVFSQMRMDKGWSLDNYLSYYFVDEFLWLGTESFVNKFREEVLSLPMLRRGELGGHRLNTLRVPFCYQFSPKLVPKPKDWPSHADVVGNFFAAGLSPAPPIAPKLDAFIAEDPSNLPVFIGFGSMAVESPEPLLKLIVAAVKKTNTRVILQNGYTKWGETFDKIQADAAGGESTKLFCDSRKLFYFLDGCPHDWLFTKIAAVVHHGGAGTVAAGLRAGKPTLVCPFFGDQFFWGELVYRAGVGPACIPSTEITVNNFAAALEALKSPGMRTAAEDMALAFSKEDGVGNGIAAFHKHLPVEDMVCDVSLFLPEAQQKNNARTLVACRWCSECQFKMSAEVDSVVHAPGTGREHHIRTKYAPIDWGTSDGPTNALDGFAQGVAGMGQEMVSAIAGLLIEPIKGGRRNGVAGGLNGVVEGLKGLVLRPLRGGLIFVDKTGAGIAAHIERERYAAKNQTRPYRRFVIYDKLFEIGQRIERGAFGWRDHPMIGSDKELSESHKAESAAGATGGGASSSAAFAPQVPTQRQSDIIKAFDIAQECRIVFSNSERSRLDGVTFAKADMMRSLSSVIAETKQKGAALSSTEKKGQRNSIAGGGVEGAQSSETISNLIDNYFGIKGGKMQFSEFVGQFLFANTSAVDERVTTQKERRGSQV